MSIGSTLTSPLPSFDIEQFGVYMTDANAGTDHNFIDNFEVDSAPEPATGALLAVAVGFTGVVGGDNEALDRLADCGSRADRWPFSSRHAFRSDQFVRFPALVVPPTTTESTEPTTRPHPPTTGPAVRVAVIGGMVDTGFWDALSIRFETETHIPVQLITTGQKDTISAIFRHGGIDLITMHASDAIINLVADGYARDPQPWARNDMIIVGPPADPAGIKGTSDAAEALKKIALTKSKFVVHSSLGAQDVMLSLMGPARRHARSGRDDDFVR